MVNAYVSYKRFMEMNRQTPINHYKWCTRVILAKIAPAEYGAHVQKESVAAQRGDHRSAANRKTSSRRSLSSVSSRSVSSRSTSKHVSKKPKTEMSVVASVCRVGDEKSHFNNKRLDLSVCHMPEACLRSFSKKGGQCCAMCRWATGKKLSAQLLRCPDCQIVLCSWCYSPFHTVAYLDDTMKQKVAREVARRKK